MSNRPDSRLEITEASHGKGGEALTAQRCPVCRLKMVVRVSGEVVIHNAILRVDSPTGRVSAKCSRCKSWVEVPLRFVG